MDAPTNRFQSHGKKRLQASHYNNFNLRRKFKLTIGSTMRRSSKKKEQMRPFWEKRHEWLPTWNKLRRGEEVSNALQVDYIRVYEYAPTNYMPVYDTTDWHWYLWGLGRNPYFG